MTRKALAALLDGNQYGREISAEQESLAKENNLVVVFAYSDDCAELRGAINDEVGCYDGGTFYVTKAGVLNEPDCGDGKCKYFAAIREKAGEIKAVWHNTGELTWSYETRIPHATFRIYEGAELFCEGIVFSLDGVAI